MDIVNKEYIQAGCSMIRLPCFPLGNNLNHQPRPVYIYDHDSWSHLLQNTQCETHPCSCMQWPVVIRILTQLSGFCTNCSLFFLEVMHDPIWDTTHTVGLFVQTAVVCVGAIYMYIQERTWLCTCSSPQWPSHVCVRIYALFNLFLWTICNIYSTVGRSIYDRGAMFAEVGYRGYGPPNRATYNILYGECATGEPFWVQRPKNFCIDTIMLNFLMVAQSPYYINLLKCCMGCCPSVHAHDALKSLLKSLLNIYTQLCRRVQLSIFLCRLMVVLHPHACQYMHRAYVAILGLNNEHGGNTE